MNRLALMLLVGFAAAPAYAEAGDVRKFSAYGDSEAQACELATAVMERDNHEPQGNGDCDSCEEQHTLDGPYWVGTGRWACEIVGVELEEEQNNLILGSDPPEEDDGQSGSND